MSRLPTDHPEVHQQFMQGGFSVQLGSQNPFGRIPVDQTIEETVNRDTQTAGSTKGFSLKRAAVERYYLTSEYRSNYLKQLRRMVGHGMSHLSHPDLQMPRITRDEADALANGDGTLRKTNKAVLARELEKQVLPAETIPGPSATIIDGMSLVQKMKGNDQTFSQHAASALTQILHEGARSQRIDVVFDVYQEDSIKNAERANRGCTTGIQFRNISPGHRIQQWRKFLSSSANKANLIRFLVAEWKTPKLRERLNEKQLYVASEESCLHITKDQWAEVAGLQSNQEEADTRMILHAAHAAEEGYSAVVVTADDTDVLLLCLAFSADISCPLFQNCGMKNRVRYLDITKLHQALGDCVCNAVIGMHAYTGCDTLSAFTGRGKLRALKLIMRSEHFQEVFRKLGQSWELSMDLFKKLQAFTCKLYTATTTTEDINTARHQLFCAQCGELESSQLPPCKDCLFMHAMHANYQAGIWRASLQQHLGMAGPEMTMASSPWNGCGDLQPLRQCCSCCPATAAVDASSRNASA
ncbi:hypothetical protein AAFF_G00025010 [Aldrovandia affinis]|uniref:Uncharacterized protein n=1 Tax=Aldrovandia affinis TaxID=143900 RepID=A0AAD7T6P5_9TELE|nr:hypothetical protein AAFF_G00025010 [Aldrovandia affinis]